MNPTQRLIAVLTLSALAAGVHAQTYWKWRDAQGRVQVSDQPPPRDVPDAAILQRPGKTAPAQAAGSGAEPAATPTAPPASAVTGQDPELEARRRKIAQEKAERQKADEERRAEQQRKQDANRQEECQRLRSHLKALESGVRMARLNDKGEREVMEDAERRQETQRVQGQLSQHCNR
ncbi:DUF4124 domain-containing protein [Ideonella livida]|uniref:DUF4124 domain-containing protein n=1 Tax=Ideonella livida TaxID=2707176 RepID=A0A7C9PFG4_9BURK|nr:DUF4124 domain-containing protein [Ideonella livida]NDY90112.1 DUF4124 domain-containing protein [Ideonella livida]